MKIDTGSWHYKTLKWAWGPGFFWKCGNDHDEDPPERLAEIAGEIADLGDEYNAAHENRHVRKMVSLCPYVDMLILGIVLSPIILGSRAFVKGFELLNENAQFFLLLCLLGVGFGVVDINLLHVSWWLGIVIGEASAWGIIGVFASASAVNDHWNRAHPPKPKEVKEDVPKPKKVKAPKPPGLFRQWLTAKHRRICPFLEFEGGAE